MTNYHQTPLHRVFEMIRREAARYGITVMGSEIVGLLPAGALLESAEYYLQLEGFSEEQLLERRLEVPEEALVAEPKADMRAFLEEVASPLPTPGGGSVAALSGALAAALATMACQLTVGKEEYAEVAKEMRAALEQTQGLQEDLFAFIEEDAQAFEALLAANRLPKDTEEERESRTMAVQIALRSAASVPLAVADRAVKVLEVLLTVVAKGGSNVLPDAGTAAQMANAAVRGSALNVRTNAASLADEELAMAFEQQIGGFEEKAKALVAQIEEWLEARL
jgi:glutamate formiminotransferase/formiminotetrahydrofolate cyclodeaminase